jgi:SAM-dependent methyltransferase
LSTQAEQADKHWFYQNSVQGVDFELDFIKTTFKAIRKRNAKTMKEDFSGTALSSVEWVKKHKNNHADAVDFDANVLDWGKQNNAIGLTDKQANRLNYYCQDVREPTKCIYDVIQAFNFSYWMFQKRSDLLQYFIHCKNALEDDGILFLDAFGGHEAHDIQEEKRECEGFYYIWDQAKYNSLTQDMQCYIHFEFDDGSRIEKAFEYRWRVWGPKELQEILADAGFSKTTFYVQTLDEETGEALDEYLPTTNTEDYDSWIAFLVAEK